jgi:hypothetical protein
MPYAGGNRSDGNHYWLTPPELWNRLNAEFGFDFDPCPYPRPEGFDGLVAEWGKSNYVNPPFTGPTAWVRKALIEQAKGKRTVFVFPLDKWTMMLLDAGARVRNLGDICWHSTETGEPGPGIGKHVACFILDPLGELSPDAPLPDSVEPYRPNRRQFSFWDEMAADVRQSRRSVRGLRRQIVSATKSD